MDSLRLALALGLVAVAGCSGAAERPDEEAPGAYVEYTEGSRDQGLRTAAPTLDARFGDDEAEAERAFAGAPQDRDDAPGPVANPPSAPGGEGGGQGGNGQGGQGQGGEGQPGGAGQQPPAGPLLIYSAELHLAVHEVESTQRAVIAIARELGGYLSYHDDSRVTVRVPARRFQDAVERVERVGDVVHRNIQAQDVSEEYRDTTLRLRNAEVVRARLEELLARAEKVKDALEVQAELARVTSEIESMKGRLRFLQDRIAFSTITVVFQPRPTEQVQTEVYRLPFPWLDELGLPSLLNLR